MDCCRRLVHDDTSIDDIQLLFEYDRWANKRVLQAAITLRVEQFTRDLGGSFRSVPKAGAAFSRSAYRFFAANIQGHEDFDGNATASLA